MKRSYISPEYLYNNVYGTYNSLEQSSFFGSKMLKIEDSLDNSSQSIIYYQNQNKEQLDLSVEKLLPSYIYSASDDKLLNHTMTMSLAQSKSQMNSNTQWVIDIKLQNILDNYLFAILKSSRTFEGVRTFMTSNNDVDFFIKEYIVKNVAPLYKLDKIELFLKYNNIISSSNLKFNNTWDSTTNDVLYKFSKFETKTSFNLSTTEVTFSQQKDGSQYNFNYFFNIYWVRI